VCGLPYLIGLGVQGNSLFCRGQWRNLFRFWYWADVSTDIDDEDFVGHTYLTFVHVIQHLLGTFSPDFIISGMAEETDADDDVAV